MRSPAPVTGAAYPLPAQHADHAAVRRSGDLPDALMSHPFRTSQMQYSADPWPHRHYVCASPITRAHRAGVLPNVTTPLQGRNMTVTPASQLLFVPLRARPEPTQCARAPCAGPCARPCAGPCARPCARLGVRGSRSVAPPSIPVFVGEGVNPFVRRGRRSGGRTGPTAGETGPPVAAAVRGDCQQPGHHSLHASRGASKFFCRCHPIVGNLDFRKSIRSRGPSG